MGVGYLPTNVTFADDTLLAVLPLRARARCLLENMKLATVGDLRRCPDEALLREPNAGERTVRELRILVPFSEDGSPTYHDLARENHILRRRVASLEGRLRQISKLAR